jgi:hypothetical protein
MSNPPFDEYNAAIAREVTMQFTKEQAENLLKMFDGKECDIIVTQDQKGEGLLAYYAEYPEEGSLEL